MLIGVGASAAFGSIYLLGRNSFHGFLPGKIVIPERPQELAYLAPYVCKSAKWGPGNLFEFINSLSPQHVLPFGKSLEIKDFETKNKAQQIEAIHRELLWQSSSIVTYPFKSVRDINYHDVVVWCAEHVGLPENEAQFTSTWDLERRILEQQFFDVWEKLSVEQRTHLLQKIDTQGSIEDKALLAAQARLAAQTALAATAYFSGFSLYTTMTVTLSTVSGWLGLTLPFAAYTTATSVVSFLAGPVGWAIGAVMLAGTFAAWAGKADLRKTVDTVFQVHGMKAAALYGAGQM